MAQVTKADSAHTVHEVQPEFPGGYKALFAYISKNFKYPESAEKTHYQGTVMIKFLIDSTGKLSVDSLDFEKMRFYRKRSDEILKKKAVDDITAEAKRVFESSPVWTPGYSNGKPVRVKYTLPFHLWLN
ncbi:hypothetical protein GCM10027291_39500 [Telluribacter humicola]